jgi:hypothetical protein
MLDSYCIRGNVALFKSRCTEITRSSVSGFENTPDGAGADPVPGGSQARDRAFLTAAGSHSRPASPPTSP